MAILEEIAANFPFFEKNVSDRQRKAKNPCWGSLQASQEQRQVSYLQYLQKWWGQSETENWNLRPQSQDISTAFNY